MATDEVDIAEDISVPRRSSSITAWVNVIYGCNEHCTYCVVPNTRGQEQSRTPAAIKNEMIQLGKAGEPASNSSFVPFHPQERAGSCQIQACLAKFWSPLT